MTIRLWHIVLFVVALLGFAAALAPAWLFARSTPGGFSYARAEGTIWRARFVDARLGPFRSAEIGWRLSLLDLVQGRFLGDATFSGGDIDGSARLLANLDGDRRIIAPSLTLSGAQAGGAALAGASALQGIDVLFIRGACDSAAGALSSTVLAANEAAFRWRGPPLAGALSCVGDDAQAVMSPSDGSVAGLAVTLTLHGDGAGEWRARLPPDTQAAAGVLAQLGAPATPEGDALIARGDMRWFPF